MNNNKEFVIKHVGWHMKVMDVAHCGTIVGYSNIDNYGVLIKAANNMNYGVKIKVVRQGLSPEVGTAAYATLIALNDEDVVFFCHQVRIELISPPYLDKEELSFLIKKLDL